MTLVTNSAEGAMNTLEFRVVGVFQSFSKEFDARAVRIPLAPPRELLQGLRAPTSCGGAAPHRGHRPHARQAQGPSSAAPPSISAAGVRQSDFYDKSVQLYDAQFGCCASIILVMVLLSVTNSVNMSVFERQGEFGTMQALGNRHRDIIRLIIVECTILGLVGAWPGPLLGMGWS